jgi:hypothetical protein
MSGRALGMGIEEFARDGRAFDVSGRDRNRRGIKVPREKARLTAGRPAFWR